jgi:ribosomal protein S27AE
MQNNNPCPICGNLGTVTEFEDERILLCCGNCHSIRSIKGWF